MKTPTTWHIAAVLVAGLVATTCRAAESPAARRLGEASASTAAAAAPACGAIDGNRFDVKPGTFWKGTPGAGSWWWQVRFAEPRLVGAILQVNGDQASVLENAPGRYRWQASLDGRRWQDLQETVVRRERRLFRVHRLAQACRAAYLRLMVDECLGAAPALREVEVYADPSAKIEFGDWIIAVSTATQQRQLPGFAAGYGPLVHDCPGWENVPLQFVWLGDFDEAFAAAEPQPLCALLSGNTLEWCQQEREPWRGVQEVLRRRHLPIWAACGGAQGLTILHDTGVDKPWDCPRCRDARSPKSPVYSHIGHTGPAKCNDYTKSIWEKGKFNVRLVARDPVFQGLSEIFEVMESHIGQIDYVPEGWVRLVTKGPGAFTENQCLRVADRLIYAAQFHIEMQGTAENSRKIMGNFLRLAKAWGGYNPQGRPVARPEALPLDTHANPENKAVLHVPSTGAQPAIDGKLEEPCWQNAARTGPLKGAHGEPGKPATEAFILRDADQLYVAFCCAGAANVTDDPPAGAPPKETEFAPHRAGPTGSRSPGRFAAHAGPAEPSPDGLAGGELPRTPQQRNPTSTPAPL